MKKYGKYLDGRTMDFSGADRMKGVKRYKISKKKLERKWINEKKLVG
jgi:hypothetical protein